MRRFVWFLVASIGLLASCRGTEPSAPAELNPGEARQELNFDCEMNAQKCQAILSAIHTLQSHPAQVCRDVGNAAFNRYNAPVGSGEGFRDGSDPTNPRDQAYVWMVPGQSFSGEVPADGWIYFTSAFWNSGYNSGQMAGIVAHEEGGHQTGADDSYHNTGVGYMLEDSCGE